MGHPTSIVRAMLVSAALVFAGGCTSEVTGTGSPAPSASAPPSSSTSSGAPGGGPASCPSASYVGDIGGAPATATIEIEVFPELTSIAGEIRTATAYYTFRGEVYGSPATGFVDVVDHGTNERFRAQIDETHDGFVLTANAYEGAGSTAYAFRCKP